MNPSGGCHRSPTINNETAAIRVAVKEDDSAGRCLRSRDRAVPQNGIQENESQTWDGGSWGPTYSSMRIVESSSRQPGLIFFSASKSVIDAVTVAISEGVRGLSTMYSSEVARYCQHFVLKYDAYGAMASGFDYQLLFGRLHSG